MKKDKLNLKLKPTTKNTTNDHKLTDTLSLDYEQFKIRTEGLEIRDQVFEEKRKAEFQEKPQDDTEHLKSMAWSDLDIATKALGSGISASVKKTVHRPTGTQLALKILPIQQKEVKPKVVLAEIGTLYTCNHPNVITMHDAYFRDSCIYLALELMDMGSLEDLVKKAGEFPEWVISKIAKQVLQGMLYLHKVRKTLHRDIKPANILINSKGEVKLTDFGMAGQLDSTLAQLETFQGTVTFMSPERIRGDPHGSASDVWAAALSLVYRALGGKLPFNCIPSDPTSEMGFFDLMDEITTVEKLPLPTDKLSPEFCEFIWAQTKQAPEERPFPSDLLQMSFITKYENDGKDMKDWLQQFQ